MQVFSIKSIFLRNVEIQNVLTFFKFIYFLHRIFEFTHITMRKIYLNVINKQ